MQVITPQHRDTTAKIEYNAQPGTLLGGAFSCTPRQGCQLVPRTHLADTHLSYLRTGYSDKTSALRQELDQLARTYRYGSNQLAIFAVEEVVAQNVIRAVEGIAARLSHPDT